MAKRDAQTFDWKSNHSADGTYLGLEIVGRKATSFEGKSLSFAISDYDDSIIEKITAAGHKAVFQQRTSQCETDTERFQYWQDLHALFVAGDWEREGGARGAPVIAPWIEAAAAAMSKPGNVVSPGQFQASWSKYPKEKRDAIKANCLKKYATEIEKIREARKSKEVDLSDLE